MTKLGADLKWFLTLTFVSSGLVEFHIIRNGGVQRSLGWVLLLMWIPGICALLLSFKSRLRDLAIAPGSARHWRLAFAIPFLAVALSFGASWLFQFSRFRQPPPIITEQTGLSSAYEVVLIGLSLNLAGGWIAALGEELGWRGFLLSHLVRSGIRWPALICGAIWAVWHLPLVLWGGYSSSNRPVFSALLFFLAAVTVGVLIAWLRFKSNSVLVATTFHAAHNVFFQFLFPLFDERGSLSPYLTGESGIFTVAAYALILIVILRHEKQTHVEAR